MKRGVAVEEKQILKELLREVVLIERDLKLNMWLIKSNLSNEEKMNIIKNLERVEEIYDRNLESIRTLNCKHIKTSINEAEVK